MHFDFAAILILAAVLTGVVWAADAWYFAPRRRARHGGGASEPVVVDYARSFFPIIVVILLLRSFVAEPFRIPSSSMMPTLLVGDFILVNKYDYGLRLPVLHDKLTRGRQPQRGEIVVFRYPENTRVDFIKRVIGVPGDHIEYRDKRLYINGERVPQELMGGFGPHPVHAVERRVEQLGDSRHEILVLPTRDGPPLEFHVPEGQYFVMGDHRDNSSDSRSWGTVPDENLVGRAILVWMNWTPGEGPQWSRIGRRIH